MKLIPIAIGVFNTFYMQYLQSGNFFKMFEVHSTFWSHNFQIPTKITDWSTEGYGMNLFSIFCLVIPIMLFFPIYFFKQFKNKMRTDVSLFSSNGYREYLFILSLIYFIGNFMFVAISQGGDLNGLHRYLFASPLFYIFFFIFIQKMKAFSLVKMLSLLIPLALTGFYTYLLGPNPHEFSFLDMGYLLLFFTLLYFVLFSKMHPFVKVSYLFLLIGCNTLWLCFLFNHYLNNSFIIV